LPKTEEKPICPLVKKQNRVFRSLLTYDLGVVVDENWNLVAGILAEDWGCMFSDPLRKKLSPKGRRLYQSFLDEVWKSMDDLRHLWDHKNLCEISRRAKKLLREADSADCITRQGWIEPRKEAREGRLIDLALERFQKLDQERPGQPDSLAGKLMLLFVSIESIKKSLRSMPRFLKR
jgi:hypothetical protein